MPLYHVTRAENLPAIRRNGVLPTAPKDMKGDPSAVYLFTDYTTMEDAVVNWLGDRFEEDDVLVLLTLSEDGIETFQTEAGYEVISYDPIPAKNILRFDFI